jgi:uncharacterized protein YlxP (DUF503 family)
MIHKIESKNKMNQVDWALSAKFAEEEKRRAVTRGVARTILNPLQEKFQVSITDVAPCLQSK